MDTLTTLRPWLEALYFASAFALAVIAAFGLRQITILKKDLAIRVERAAKEKAVEFSGRYLDRFVSLANKAHQALKTKELKTYKGEVGDFTPSSLSPQQRLAITSKLQAAEPVISALNELEFIAAAFVYGVAHDETGFQIIGRTFCHSVHSYYDFLAGVRADKALRYYEPIISLYKTWSPRLSKQELKSEKESIEAALRECTDNKIRSIGEDKT